VTHALRTVRSPSCLPRRALRNHLVGALRRVSCASDRPPLPAPAQRLSGRQGTWAMASGSGSDASAHCADGDAVDRRVTRWTVASASQVVLNHYNSGGGEYNETGELHSSQTCLDVHLRVSFRGCVCIFPRGLLARPCSEALLRPSQHQTSLCLSGSTFATSAAAFFFPSHVVLARARAPACCYPCIPASSRAEHSLTGFSRPCLR
jgi:hypothetical protein